MRRAILMLLVVGLFAGACSSSSEPSARGGSPPSTMALLFVAGGSAGSLGSDSLVLTGVSPSVTWFSDRPARRAGRETLTSLVDHWAGFGFASDPPNAALSVAGGATTVVELTSPRYDAGAQSLSFSAKALAGPRERLEFVTDRVGSRVPPSFGAANLFIDDADVPAAISPGGELTPANSAPVLYVTFSGESSKGASAPISAVMGFTAQGDSLDVLQKGSKLTELRGMALGGDGSLYVANAYKKDTKIVLFGPPGEDGTRPYVGDYAKNDSANPGLDHPYGLAFDGSGNLLASSQDTCVVTRLAGSEKGAPGSTAAWLQSNSPGQTFFPGTVVAEATSAKGSDCPSERTKVDGGVQWPRGIAVAGGTLYVADNPGGRVRAYDVASGTPKASLYPMADPNNPPSPAPAPVGVYVSGSTLYVSNEGTNDVWAFDTTTGEGSQVIATTTPATPSDIVLDGPAGLTCGPDGALYLNNRKAQQILRYDLASRSVRVFADHLTDQPEQIMAAVAPPPICN